MANKQWEKSKVVSYRLWLWESLKETKGHKTSSFFFVFFFISNHSEGLRFHNGRKRYVGEKICFVLASTSKIVPKFLKRYEMSEVGTCKKKHGM